MLTYYYYYTKYIILPTLKVGNLKLSVESFTKTFTFFHSEKQEYMMYFIDNVLN